MAREGIDPGAFCQRGAATKQFDTRYYSVDIHKAALVSPEVMREALKDQVDRR